MFRSVLVADQRLIPQLRAPCGTSASFNSQDFVHCARILLRTIELIVFFLPPLPLSVIGVRENAVLYAAASQAHNDAPLHCNHCNGRSHGHCTPHKHTHRLRKTCPVNDITPATHAQGSDLKGLWTNHAVYLLSLSLSPILTQTSKKNHTHTLWNSK